MSKHKRRKKIRKFSTWILQMLRKSTGITPEENEKIVNFFHKEFGADREQIYFRAETPRMPWVLTIYCQSLEKTSDSWNYGLNKKGEFVWCSTTPSEWHNCGADLLTKKFKAL